MTTTETASLISLIAANLRDHLTDEGADALAVSIVGELQS